MVVNTAGRGGQNLIKHFRVYTNDPKHPRANLVISGKVSGYMEVTPSRVNLMGRTGDTVVQEVRIVPRKGYPFIIKEARARTGHNIRVDLKPLGEKISEAGYLLTVASTRKDPGSFGDYIEIKTDLKEKPTFGIPVRGRIYAAPAERRSKDDS